MFWKVFGIIIVVFSLLGRIKYIWSAQKIKRVGQAEAVSRKFYMISVVCYLLMFIYNFKQKDFLDCLFWGAGIFAVIYALIMCYKYKEKEMSWWKFIKDSFNWKNLIYDTFGIAIKKD